MSQLLNYSIIKSLSNNENILVIYIDKFLFIENYELVIKDTVITYKNKIKEYKTEILNDEILNIVSKKINVIFIDDLGNILSDKILIGLSKEKV